MSISSDMEDEQLVLCEKNHKIKKLNNKKQSSKQNNEIVYDIGKNKRVRIYNFKNMRLVDIRALYRSSDGEMMPSKKGISLTKDDFLEFCELVDDIKKNL